ncbi:MAG: tRNA (adenosine(37)-N6)-dimethylallyltransferase MiaA [Proteiniphilum sp.]|nr:tRNA (adenosine(37)-N6)-dimethylallyltransferase MiaA [Proteiniphilum sp.]
MNILLVLLGPTGVGKTEWSLKIAEALGNPIISADSRQIYQGMTIGTAAPTEQQLQRVPHHFVGILDPREYYSASQFEEEAVTLAEQLFETHSCVVMTGGSMMYIDAVCHGIDEIPTIDEQLREEVHELYRTEGLDAIRSRLKIVDPLFYDEVDLKNPKRVIHALEVCLMSGKPYSSLRSKQRKERPFRILKIGFMRERGELYDRINIRVDEMIEKGLVEEARHFYPMRHLNALNTVGYKELFDYFDGNSTLDFTIDKIKQHSRNYARKQMTWFKRDKDIHWINLSDEGIDVAEEVFNLLRGQG